MKNDEILILKIAVAIIFFSLLCKPCAAQTNTTGSMQVNDSLPAKKDTERKAFLINWALLADVLGNYRPINTNTFQKLGDNNFTKNRQVDTAKRKGSEMLVPQNLSLKAGPDLITPRPESHFSGWIGYTTSRTERLFDNRNDFNWFPTVQDRIHDFSLMGTYQFNDRFKFSGNLIQSNGNLIYGPSGNVYNSYEANNVRFDLRATVEGQPNQNFRNSWSLGIYNLNGYWNSGSAAAGTVDNKILPKPVPSVSWNLLFH